MDQNAKAFDARRRPRVKHWLLTLALAPHTHLHAYVMSTNKRHARDAAAKLLNEAERLRSSYPLASIILMTRLSSGTELVREIIAARSKEAASLLREATDFHFSVWSTHASEADDAKLMELH
jgi:hypothetical protein